MRLDVKTGATFKSTPSTKATHIKPVNGFSPDTFYEDEETGFWGRKAHVTIDYGTHERVVWFDDDYSLSDFMGSMAPMYIQNSFVTK